MFFGFKELEKFFSDLKTIHNKNKYTLKKVGFKDDLRFFKKERSCFLLIFKFLQL